MKKRHLCVANIIQKYKIPYENPSNDPIEDRILYKEKALHRQKQPKMMPFTVQGFILEEET